MKPNFFVKLISALFLIFAALFISGCGGDKYVIVPKSMVTCGCADDTTRMEILNSFMSHKFNQTQTININANKVKHNQFNQTLKEEFADFFPRRVVYYVVKYNEVDRVLDQMSNSSDPDEQNYYCTLEQAAQVRDLLNNDRKMRYEDGKKSTETAQ